MNEKVSMIIAEDEPAILRSIKNTVMNMSTNIDVVGTAYNGKDAWELINKYEPDIVISDIMMPIMNGLEMIQTARSHSFQTRFIILTGYEKFEYAKKALQLGVSDYLLKPIDFSFLEETVLAVRDVIVKKRKNERKEYIERAYRSNGTDKQRNPIKDCDLYVASIFWGAAVSKGYDNFHIALDIIKNLNSEFFKDIEYEYGIDIYHFQGYYPNEYIAVMAAEKGKRIPVSKIGCKILKKLVCTECFVHVCISDVINNAGRIHETAGKNNMNVLFYSAFGKNGLLECPIAEKNKKIEVSGEVEKIADSITSNISKMGIAEIAQKIITFWNDTEKSQFQIQIDLSFLLSYALQKSVTFKKDIPDAAELICYAYSYDILQGSVQYEFEKLLLLERDASFQNKSVINLSEEVKQYLDKHFTEQITYKTFNDIFKYNEKYITTVFKEAYGVSPSKYVLGCRMELAKKIMCEQPDELLKDVAEIVGYPDPLYFSRVFKSNVGVSPSQFIKNNVK